MGDTYQTDFENWVLRIGIKILSADGHPVSFGTLIQVHGQMLIHFIRLNFIDVKKDIFTQIEKVSYMAI